MPKIKCGLEIHGYLNVDAKLFCNCKLEADTKPNTNICPVCTGQPGSKPMAPNEKTLNKLLAIGLMLDCTINKRLFFQRKHYNWPDMPNGYQKTISGSYSVPVGVDGNFLGIGIEQVHLEEDPARWDPNTGGVDYNRAGFPLVEIVTKPEFESADQVREWLKKLTTTLSYINAINADAGIKSDVNISIEPKYERVEVKNVNSFKSIVKTIEYEIKRQIEEVSQSKPIPQQTRRWDEKKGITEFMRSKEQAADYRFIPEPDLKQMYLADSDIDLISKQLPEKPSEKIKKYKKMKVDATDAEIISSDILLAELFEKLVEDVDPILAAKWLRRELLRVLHFNKKELEELETNEKHISQLLKLVEENKITEKVAKKILEELIVKDFDVNEYVKKHKLEAVSDAGELVKYCKEAIEENPKAVQDYKSGNEPAINFIVGQVMRKTRGKATPNEVNKILKDLLK